MDEIHLSQTQHQQKRYLKAHFGRFHPHCEIPYSLCRMIWFAVSGCILSLRSSVISDACAQKSLDATGVVTVTGTGAHAANKRLIAPIAFNGFVLLKDVESSIDGFHVLV